MNSIVNIKKTVKPAYESVSCSVTEIEMQGVLCASNSESGGLFGGLGPYSGSAL